MQAFIKAFAPHGGLVAGELVAGCNDIGVGGFVLFGRAHLAASSIFLRSPSKEASKEASMLHNAGWSNVTAKRRRETARLATVGRQTSESPCPQR